MTGSLPPEDRFEESMSITTLTKNLAQKSEGVNSSILNSWKEIARHLDPAVRTIQRWANKLGLPFHRTQGQTLVPSHANGHAGRHHVENSSEDEAQRPSVARIEPDLSKNEHRRRDLILSVDDEPSLLYTRAKILEREGYEVLSAGDGEEALELLGRHAVDLVLLDYKMPGMDGGTLAREMKQRMPMVPLIMVSGNHVAGEILDAVDSFIPKGEAPELLLTAIQQLLVR
jgi:CheY-like chemotaxis protein